MANTYSAADFARDYLDARKKAKQENGGYATADKVQKNYQQATSGNSAAKNFIQQESKRQQSYGQNIDYWTKKYNTGISETTDENGITKRTWTGQVKDPSTGKVSRQTVEIPTAQQYQERYNQYQRNLAEDRTAALTDQYKSVVDRANKAGDTAKENVSTYQENIRRYEKQYGVLVDQANRIRESYGLDPVEKRVTGKVAGFDLVTEEDVAKADKSGAAMLRANERAGSGRNYQERQESIEDFNKATEAYAKDLEASAVYNLQNEHVRDNASEEQGKQLLQQIEDYDKQAAAAKTAAEAERARQLAARARELLEINDYYKNKAAVVGRMSDEEFASTYTAQNLADSDELLAQADALSAAANQALWAGKSAEYRMLIRRAEALRSQAYGMVGGDAEARSVVEKRLQVKELESGVEKGRDYLKYVNLGEQKNFIPQLREWFANNQRDIGNALRNIYAESVIPGATDSDPTAGMAQAYIEAMTTAERNTYYYYLGRNDEAKAQQYFSAIEPVLEQRMSETMQVEMAEVTAEHPVLGVVANAALSATVQPVMGTVATAENLIRSAAGEDAITSGAIYAASDLNQGAVSGLAENIQKNFNVSEESAAFWANNIVSMANNLAQTAVYRVGAFAGGAEAVSKVNKWMPLILMSTNAATETVRQELAEGGSAGKALLYGAAVGGAEMLTEMMGLDSWFDLASGKTGATFLKYITKNGVDLGGLRGAVQAVLGIGQQAITEGTEELISTFTSAVADVLINGESASLIQSQRQYITEGATKEEAFRKAMLDFAKEATESFAGGAVSGGVFGVTGAVGSLRNSNAIGEAVQSMGNAEVYALVEYGNEFAEGTKTHEIASRLTEAINQNENYMPSAGVLTELSLAMESDAKTAMASLSKESTAAAASTKEGASGLSVTASGLISTGMVTATEARAMNTVLNKVATNQKVTDAELHVLRASAPKIRETLSNMMGVEIVDGSDGAMRAAIQVFQQRQASSQKQKEAATKAAQILKPAVAVAKGKERVAVQAEVDAAMASAESYANAEAEVSGIEELAAFEAESAYEASEAKADEAPAASINYAEFSEEYRQSHPKATQEEIMTAYKAAEKSGKATASSKKMTAQDITVEQIMEQMERRGEPVSRGAAEEAVAKLRGRQTETKEAAQSADVPERKQYFVSDSFADELDNWDGKSDKTFTVGTTSSVLESIGVENRAIVWHGAKISKVMKKHPEMTLSVIKQVPTILEDPNVILKSIKSDSRIVVIGELNDAAGNPVLTVLELQPTGKGGRLLNLNIVASAYGKSNNVKNFIQNSEVLYINEDAKRTESWLQGLGLQLPSDTTSLGSIGSITYQNGTVNISGIPWAQLSLDDGHTDTVKEGSGTEGKYSKEKPNYVAEWLARDFRKLFGKYIKSVEVRYDLPTGAGAPRGWNAGGKIVLNGQLGDTTVDGVFRSAQDILVYTLSHEVGHSAQGNTSAGYDAQTDAIIQMYRDLNPRFTDAQLEERINKEIAKNRSFARKMELAGEDAGFKASDFGRTEAREEVACNMLGEMMVDYNVLSKMMPRHKTIVQRAQTRVSEVLKAIRRLSPKASKSGEISIAKAYELAAEEIEQTLTDALEAVQGAKNPATEGGAWYAGKSLIEDKEVYSYDFLAALPDMTITELPSLNDVKNGERKIRRDHVVKIGMESARDVGTVRNGKVYVQNLYTGREITVGVNSIRHGLDGASNRLITNSLLGAEIGKIVQRAVPINSLTNEDSNVSGTYAMAAYATDPTGREYIAIVTVEQRGGRLESFAAYDLAHSVSGRAKKIGSQADAKSQSSISIKATTISIANLLDAVNNTYQSILSEDVLKHFGETRNPTGYYSESAKFSLSDDSDTLESLRETRSQIISQLDMAGIDGLSEIEERRLRQQLAKVNAEIDSMISTERSHAVKTSMQEIMDNLSNYRRSDLESLAEQISDSAWDGYEDLSREELEEALREAIAERELSPLEMQSRKNGLFVKPPSNIRYSISDDTDDAVSITDSGTVTKYSLATWTPETEAEVRSNLVNAGYDSQDVDRWIGDVNGVAAEIAADRDRLDFEAADNQTMLKNNQEYVKTLDASTLCAKRLAYQGTFNAIQHRLPNTMLSSDDLIDLLNMMKAHGVQTPCGVCYVESRRRHLGKFAQKWLDGYEGAYKPNLDEVTTSDGLEALRKSHPDTYSDFIAAMNAKGSANPKVVQLRTEYRNEIMSLTPAQIRKIEAIGGLRVQSFSDFETPHLLDMMQAVMDMSARGLTSQAYTKVPNFAWVFGDTGIKINLSLIAEGNGFDANGNLAFSSVEGMDFDEAMKLRDAYSDNVGTIIVGANDEHILACMADDRIDFIIPFHRSGWGQRELDMMNMSSYDDYTYGQNEHSLETGKTVANLYPPDYWNYNISGKENAERYLSLCAQTGREPKFSQFLVNNGDGSYSLQPDGSTDGYWKMLIDFKMYNNEGVGVEQQPVRPNFNMDEAYRVLREYEGGANTLPVAQDVVEEFVQKKRNERTQYSISDDEAAEREASKAEAARLAREAKAAEKKAAEAKASNADPKLIENLEAEANDLRTEAEDARLMGQTDSETIAEGMAEGGFTPKTQLQLWEEQSNAKDGKTLTAQERMDQIVKEILERNNKAKQTKVSRTYSHTLVGGGFISEAEQGIEGLRAEDATYDVVSEKESLSEAKNRLDKNYVYWYDELPKREKWSGKDLDTAMLIFGQVQSESAISGDYSESIRWAQLIREKGTQGGQFLQAFRKYTKTTIGQVIDKTKDLDERYINEKGDNAALDDLRKQNKKAAKDLDQLTIDNEKLDKEYEELMERYNALRSELEAARKERNSTKGKILRAIDKTDALDKENIRLQGELDRLEDLLSWKLAEVSTVSRENRNLVVQSRRLASRLQRAQQRLSDAATRNEQLKEALEALRAKDTEASDATRGLADRLTRRINAHNRELENQIAALSGEVTGAKRTKKAVDNASTAEGVRKAISKTGAEALGDYLKDVADALDSALSNDKKAALINEMARFAGLIDACVKEDKETLITIISNQAKMRNTKWTERDAEAMRKQEWQYVHDFAVTQLLNIADDYVKRSFGEKLTTIQRTNQLNSLKTVERNILGNAAFYVQEGAAKNMGTIFDAFLGKISGKVIGQDVSLRTVSHSFHNTKGMTKGVRTGLDRMATARLEVKHDVSVESYNKYGNGANRTFKMAYKKSQKGFGVAVGRFLNNAQSKSEEISSYGLVLPDEFFKGAAYQSTMNSLASLVATGHLTQEEAEQLAVQQMAYNTFQDETWLGKKLNRLHDLLNQKEDKLDALGKPLPPSKLKIAMREIGPGDIVVKYRTVPGALIHRSIEYSPAGLLKTIDNSLSYIQALNRYHNLQTKASVEGEQSITAEDLAAARSYIIGTQKATAMALARSLTGSGLMALAYFFAKAGCLGNSEDEEDLDARAVNAAEGISGTQLNIQQTGEAIAYWLKNGLSLKGFEREWQDGDDLVDAGFLDPTSNIFVLATLLAEGVREIEEGRAVDTNFIVRLFGSNIDMILQGFNDLSMMDTVTDLMYTIMYHDAEKDLPKWLELTITFASSAVTSFTPALVRQAAQAFDPYYRDTYGGSGAIYDALVGAGAGDKLSQAIQKTANEVAVNIPGLRNLVDTKIDSFGRDKSYGVSDTFNALNALLFPSKYAKYNPSEASRELRRVARETGDASIYPDRNAPSSLQFGNERIDLTPDQRRTWQTTMGQTYDQMVGEMMSGDAYQNADNEGKVKLLKDLESYVEYKARQEIYREVYGEEYSNDQWAKTEYGMNKLGMNFGDVRQFLSDIAAIEPERDEDTGEVVEGSSARQVLEHIDGLEGYTDEQKVKLYGLADGSKSDGFMSSAASKVAKMVEAGMSFGEAAAVKNKYNELNATREANANAMKDVDVFDNWMRSEGYSQEERTLAHEMYGFWQSNRQTLSKMVSDLEADGVSYDTAYEIAGIVSQLEPEAGEDEVSDAQKFKAVLGSSLTSREKQMAIEAIGGVSSKFGSLDQSIAENLMRVYEETGVTSVLSIQPPSKYTVDSVKHEFSDEQYEVSVMAYTAVMNNMSGGYLTNDKLVESAKDIASNAAKYEALKYGGEDPDINSSDYNAYRKALRAQEVGLDLSYYVTVVAHCNAYKADQKADGTSITGSKKKKVVAYLQEIGLTSEQYNFFYKDVFDYSY